MTPEQEAQLLALVTSMKAKLDSADKALADDVAKRLTEKRQKLADATNEKLDSFKDWSEADCDKMLLVIGKNAKAKEDGYANPIPKLDSANKEIPPHLRVNWSKVQYPPI